MSCSPSSQLAGAANVQDMMDGRSADTYTVERGTPMMHRPGKSCSGCARNGRQECRGLLAWVHVPIENTSNLYDISRLHVRRQMWVGEMKRPAGCSSRVGCRRVAVGSGYGLTSSNQLPLPHKMFQSLSCGRLRDGCWQHSVTLLGASRENG